MQMKKYTTILGAATVACSALAASFSSQAANLKEPPVFASSGGVLDITMIAEPHVVDGLTTPGYAPKGWVYTVCPRPASGDGCPEGLPTTASPFQPAASRPVATP